jgi:hypothetical protein
MADKDCKCHNERWLKSDCSDQVKSKGTTLYIKVLPPTPPTPSPPTPAPVPAPPVWPPPQSMDMSGLPATLSNSFHIVHDSSSSVVKVAVARYSAWLAPGEPARNMATGSSSPAGIINTLTISVSNASEHLGSTTNYSYSIDITSGSSEATASCSSVYAVGYALETFAQLAAGGQLFSDIRVRDSPRYR